MIVSGGVVEISGLPASPVDAATSFYQGFAKEVRGLMARDDVTVVFPAASHSHQAWRLAAIQELAREAAPKRVNGVVGRDGAAVAEVVKYLHDAPGVTGQILEVDGNLPSKD